MLAETASDAAVILVGTMADLEERREVSFDEAEAFAKAHGMAYIETSAKTGANVTEALIGLWHSMQSRLSPSVQPKLLWRGTRDGFGAKAFHDRCDRHANTVTVIEDTRGNIFGGFTPLAWESRFVRRCLSDETKQSFLFTAKNPHGIAMQRLPLIGSRKDFAVTVSSRTGPWFGEGDLVICDHCDTEPSHTRGLGCTYENAAQIKDPLLFSGSDVFVVKEIEVFECCPDRLGWLRRSD
jgi:hypothetical protein